MKHFITKVPVLGRLFQRRMNRFYHFISFEKFLIFFLCLNYLASNQKLLLKTAAKPQVFIEQISSEVL